VPRPALILLLILFPAALFAAEPRIQNLSAVAAGGKVSVRFTMSGAFSSEEVTHALQSGLPTSFSYVVEIYRARPNWFDEGIARSRIEVIATFNSVTREYLLNYRRDRKLVRSETFTDLGELQRRMTVVEEHELFDIDDRRPNKLKVRVKAEFRRGWVLYIVPWPVSTPWEEVRVKAQEP